MSTVSTSPICNNSSNALIENTIFDLNIPTVNAEILDLLDALDVPSPQNELIPGKCYYE